MTSDETSQETTVDHEPDPTRPTPVGPPAVPAPPAFPAPPAAPAPPPVKAGPAPFALFLGLVGLGVAGAILVGELADVSIPWSTLGPWAVVAGGLVVIVVGVLGLRADRRQD